MIIIIIIIVKNALDLSVKAFSRKVLTGGDTILHLQLYVVMQAMWRSSPLQGKGSKYLVQVCICHSNLCPDIDLPN